MAKKNNSNSGKIKITQVSTGSFFLKDPETAKQILNHPRFKGVYISETLVTDPPELTEDIEKVSDNKEVSGAASEKQADDSTK